MTVSRYCAVFSVRGAVSGVSGDAPPDWREHPLRSFLTDLCWKLPVNVETRHSVMWIFRWWQKAWSAVKNGHRLSGQQGSAGLSGV
ncbi:hypothetical protein ROD_p1391 (plasmid) [Citrobacter rodentium ICC168]|uniref:Uncharacterized protein n=1 Tax=Citrobacter rodentium (strain ICC168) TaxID=637910 RepID=D2TV57_CITRI|nr:hypothetical protein ROD_p1391 [Citrobacter rodentium ICC168]